MMLTMVFFSVGVLLCDSTGEGRRCRGGNGGVPVQHHRRFWRHLHGYQRWVNRNRLRRSRLDSFLLLLEHCFRVIRSVFSCVTFCWVCTTRVMCNGRSQRGLFLREFVSIFPKFRYFLVFSHGKEKYRNFGEILKKNWRTVLVKIDPNARCA